MTTTAVLRAGQVAAPRGARVAAGLFTRLLGWAARPVTAQKPSRAAEAADVREMAYRVLRTDPGFAADLFAAADRHEGQDD
jgi:hypothetical protein